MRREAAVAVADRLELTAVHSPHALRQQSELPADGHDAVEDVANARAVVVPEVSDRPAPGVRSATSARNFVGTRAPGAGWIERGFGSHRLDLQQHCRGLGRAARGCGCHPFEARRRQIADRSSTWTNASTTWTGWSSAMQSSMHSGGQRDLTSFLAFGEARHTGSVARYVREASGSEGSSGGRVSYALDRNRRLTPVRSKAKPP